MMLLMATPEPPQLQPERLQVAKMSPIKFDRNYFGNQIEKQCLLKVQLEGTYPPLELPDAIGDGLDPGLGGVRV
jgi:hypothetical protein